MAKLSNFSSSGLWRTHVFTVVLASRCVDTLSLFACCEWRSLIRPNLGKLSVFSNIYMEKASNFFAPAFGTRDVSKVILLVEEPENRTIRQPALWRTFSSRMLLSMEVTHKAKSGEIEVFSILYTGITLNILARAFGASDVFTQTLLGRRAKKDQFGTQCVWRTLNFRMFL